MMQKPSVKMQSQIGHRQNLSFLGRPERRYQRLLGTATGNVENVEQAQGTVYDNNENRSLIRRHMILNHGAHKNNVPTVNVSENSFKLLFFWRVRTRQR